MLESRDEVSMQQYADELPQAQRYSSDQLSVYGDLLWPDTPEGEGSSYVISYGKEQTYTIESINADLRTYLGRLNADLRTYLGRLKRRSRCFSRSIDALRRAVRMFVWFYNRRRRLYLANPRLKGNLCLYY